MSYGPEYRGIQDIMEGSLVVEESRHRLGLKALPQEEFYEGFILQFR